MNDPNKQPVVQTVPTFKAGETAINKDSRDEFEVIGITPDRKLRLAGVAGVFDPANFEKKA